MSIQRGDCLDVLSGMPEGGVDLIYCDPPFFTQTNWKGAAGEFSDKWRDMDDFVGAMRQRAEAMKRVLKPGGSLYWHCDPTASHYLKVMLDGVFGRDKFRREIVWSLAATGGFKPAAENWARSHDTILYYAGEGRVFNKEFRPYSPQTLDTYRHTDADGKRCQKRGGRVLYPKEGVPVGSVWDGIPNSYHQARAEKHGYPTQKPIKLLSRIIAASSNPGDLVFDPFMGSGTTLVAAKKLGREYGGCDISADAVALAEKRLAGETGCLL